MISQCGLPLSLPWLSAKVFLLTSSSEKAEFADHGGDGDKKGSMVTLCQYRH